jgi:hypothetical protein
MRSSDSQTSDGTIVERAPGVFYQYVANQNTWVRLDGYKSIKLATAISDGLMAKEDFKKVNKLLVSPPRVTLTSDKCATTFSSGEIGFYSSDESLFIEDTLDLRLPTGEVQKEPWQIHENTWGLNFQVNLRHLISELQSRDNFILNLERGPQGPQGDKGPPGIDKLDTGPKGPQGESGTNAPFDGVLVRTEGFEIDEEDNRAVVQVETETVEDENYIVVTRGIIGNTEACPNKVNVQDEHSPWALITSSTQSCTPGCGIQTEGACDSYFLDMEPIIDIIVDQFYIMLYKAKAEKEALAEEWLRTLMTVFNDVKAALCCALENCRSRKRNAEERRYLETKRMEAAANNMSLVISNDPAERIYFNMNEGRDCESDTEEAEIEETQPEANAPCNTFDVRVELNGSNNKSNPAELDLPAGDYTARVATCCFQYATGWSADVEIEYTKSQYDYTPDGTVGTEVRDTVRFMSGEMYRNRQEAEAYYRGLTVEFKHGGGPVKIYNPKYGNVFGSVRVEVWRSPCLDHVEGPFYPIQYGTTEYDDWCIMNHKQIHWYERGWKTEACIGGVAEHGGHRWIITYRSLLHDVEGGEGERIQTECIDKFITAGIGHPAIAWQTANDEDFLGIPTSGDYVFAYDPEMSEKLRQALLDTDYKTVADINEIGPILIPVAKASLIKYYDAGPPGFVLGDDCADCSDCEGCDLDVVLTAFSDGDRFPPDVTEIDVYGTAEAVLSTGASPDCYIIRVDVSLNGGNFVLADGIDNWSARVGDLVPGTNTIRIRATTQLGLAKQYTLQVQSGAPPGDASFTTPGTYQWTVPEGVYSVNVAAIGGGGGGGSS